MMIWAILKGPEDKKAAFKIIKKTLGLIGKTHTENPNAQNLIKPVENEDFLSQNRKMVSKMIKKALRL